MYDHIYKVEPNLNKKNISPRVCIKQKNSNSILERVHDLDRNS